MERDDRPTHRFRYDEGEPQPEQLRGEETWLDDAIPAHVRAYIYRTGAALVPILTGYGAVSESDAGLWLGLLGALMAVGTGTLAASHTRADRRGGGR